MTRLVVGVVLSSLFLTIFFWVWRRNRVHGKDSSAPVAFFRSPIWLVQWIFPALVAGGLYLFPLLAFESPTFSFDPNDDATISFPSLAVARGILAQGEWPQINYYNNFGTPLAGDGTTLAFAPQALTYVFLPPHVGMTVNRFLACFLSMVLLVGFFRRHVPPGAAALAAFWVTTFPNWLWHSQHHHYQMTIFCLALILLTQSRLHEKFSVWRMAQLFAALLMANISVSPNMTVYLHGFSALVYVLHVRIREKSAVLRWFAYGTLVLASFAVVLPDWVAFIRNIGLSKRVGMLYLPSQEFTLDDAALALIGGFKVWQGYDISVTIPGILIVLSVYGFWRDRKRTERSTWAWIGLLAGTVPFLYVYLALLFKEVLWYPLPFFKSTDITRILWFSMVFLLIPVSRCLMDFLKGEWPVHHYRIAALAFFGWSLVYLITPEPLSQTLVMTHMGFFLLLAILSLWKGGVPRGGMRWTLGIGFGVWAFALVARYPVYDTIQGGGKSPAHHAGFPRALYGEIGPGVRLATAGSPIGSIGSLDMRGAHRGVFGAAADCTLNYAPFNDLLLKTGRIRECDPLQVGGVYYFSEPWRGEDLARYGIQYLLVPTNEAPRVNPKEWRMVATSDFYDSEQMMTLFSNRAPTGVFYIEKNGVITPLTRDAFTVKGNRVRVHLPQSNMGSSLVATFKHLRDFRFLVDGKQVPSVGTTESLIRIPLDSEGKVVDLRYEAFPRYLPLLGLGIAGFLFFCAGLFFGKVNTRSGPV